MRFIMVGAGAIGGTLGGNLARAGYDVVLIEPWHEHREAINARGLVLRGVGGLHTVKVPAVGHPSELAFKEDDIVFMAVKSYHTAEAASALRAATALEVPIFCAQNGVRNEEVVARTFRHTHGVMLLIGAKVLQPGEVIHTSWGPIGLGRFPEGLDDADLAAAAALEKAGFKVYTSGAIMRSKWNKLLLNLNNASHGLTGLSGQEARNDPVMRQILTAVFEEGARVLRAAGIPFEPPPDEPTIDERIQEMRSPAYVPPKIPADEELKGRPSLWQDLYHKRGRAEDDHFNGEIARLAKQAGISAPINSKLLELCTAAAEAKEPPGKYTPAELKRLLGI
jgi:2-dehydropantoate 2-reductase